MAAPLQMAQMFNAPMGIRSFGMPIIGETTGRVFFVDSTSPNAGNDNQHGSEPFGPFATLAYAASALTAGNRGDRLYIMPGHVETITANLGVNLSVAGVLVIGMGIGRDRPVFTLATSTAASIGATAANCAFINCVIDMTGIDGIGAGGAGAGGIQVKAADFLLKGCEIILASAGNQASYAVALNSVANRCKIIDNLFTGTTTPGPFAAIDVYGNGALTLEGVEIGFNRIVGDFTQAGILVEMTDVARNFFIHDNIVAATGVAQTAIKITAGAGSTGVVKRNDVLATDMTLVFQSTTGFANIENKGYDLDTDNLLGVDVPLVGTQLPANTSFVDQMLGGEFSSKHADYIFVQANLANAAWNTVAKHGILTVSGLVRVIIIPACETDLTDAGGATICLGDAVATNAYIADTTAANIDALEIWLTTTPAKRFAKSSVIDVIINDTTIGYELKVAAGTAGLLDFHCWVVPLGAGGTGSAVAGTGGTF